MEDAILKTTGFGAKRIKSLHNHCNIAKVWDSFQRDENRKSGAKNGWTRSHSSALNLWMEMHLEPVLIWKVRDSRTKIVPCVSQLFIFFLNLINYWSWFTLLVVGHFWKPSVSFTLFLVVPDRELSNYLLKIYAFAMDFWTSLISRWHSLSLLCVLPSSPPKPT